MGAASFIEVALDEVRIALPLRDIERIVRAVAITPMPAGAQCLLGVIDVAGELIPVYEARKILGFASRPMLPSDRIVLTRAPGRCGLLVDGVLGTLQSPAIELSDAVAMHAPALRGVARGNNGVLLVQDMARLLAIQRASPIVAHA